MSKKHFNLKINCVTISYFIYNNNNLIIVHINITDEAKRKLLEWKAEREQKKKGQGSQKKPPFVVGIVRHHFYSPVTTTKNSVTITKKKTSAEAQKNSSHQKGITRATEKRLLSKIANVTKQKPPAISNAKKSPANENFDKRESFAPIGHKFNPPAVLPKLPLFGEVSVEDDLINNNIFAHDNSTEKVIPVSIVLQQSLQFFCTLISCSALFKLFWIK